MFIQVGPSLAFLTGTRLPFRSHEPEDVGREGGEGRDVGKGTGGRERATEERASCDGVDNGTREAHHLIACRRR